MGKNLEEELSRRPVKVEEIVKKEREYVLGYRNQSTSR
jgi:hypothetical protein